MIRVVVDGSVDGAVPVFDVVPVTLRFGDGSSVDVTSDDDIWSLLGSGSRTPEIVAPPASAYRAAFDRLVGIGASGIVVLTPSARISASHQAAVMAAEASSLGVPIRVIDSHTLGPAYGMIAATAGRIAVDDATIDQVVQTVLAEIGKHTTLIAVDTVEYLRRGRRIGGWNARLAALFDLKPLLSVEGDVVESGGVARQRERALDVLLRRAIRQRPGHIAAVHAAADDVAPFSERLAAVTGLDVPVVELGPTLATHTGPGAIGFVSRRR